MRESMINFETGIVEGVSKRSGKLFKGGEDNKSWKIRKGEFNDEVGGVVASKEITLIIIRNE